MTGFWLRLGKAIKAFIDPEGLDLPLPEKQDALPPVDENQPKLVKPEPPHGMIKQQHEQIEVLLKTVEAAVATFSYPIPTELILYIDLVDEPPEVPEEMNFLIKSYEDGLRGLGQFLNDKLLYDFDDDAYAFDLSFDGSYVFQSDYEKELETRIMESIKGLRKIVKYLNDYWIIAAQKSRIDFSPSIDSQPSTKSLPSS